MEFQSTKDIYALENGGSVKIGWCTKSGERFRCVEKIYDHENGVSKVVEKFEEFGDDLKDLGPDIFWHDEASRTIYMEYIHSQTIDEYMDSITLYAPINAYRVRELMDGIDTLFKKMDERNLCHQELHLGNVVLRDDMTLRIVDIDTLKRRSDVDHCDDKERFIGDIMKKIKANVRTFTLFRYEKEVEDMNKTHFNMLPDHLQQEISDDKQKLKELYEGNSGIGSI